MSSTALTAGPARRGEHLGWSMAGVGAVAALVVGAYALSGRLGAAAAAGVLPSAWLVSGALALRARPDHISALLMTAVGALHLAAFALTVPMTLQAQAQGWAAWTSALFANLLFALGFASLAVLLANYPDGDRPGTVFPRVAFGLAAAVPLVEAFTHRELALVAQVVSSSVPAPTAVPVTDLGFSLFPVVPALVVAGAALLVRRGRHATGVERRRLSWAVGAGGLVALLLLASPAATALLPDDVWSVLFVAGASTVPFVLLGGLVRYRLMDVDVYVARSLAQGAVVVIVVSVYALAATWAEGREPLAALVVVVAAVTGGPLRSRLEGLADRFLTGGRVRSQALMRSLVDALESTGPSQAAQRTADTLATGLDVSWVEVTLDSGVRARSERWPGARSQGDRSPAVVVPLLGADETIGTLTCGPRHGGWSETEVEQVRVLGRHAALALHSAELAAAMALQVEQLQASRTRLVHAEQSVRRRLERDLHDGVQQQLVALLSRLGALEILVDPASPAAEFTRLAKRQAELSLAELRELVRGIHPPVLADRGLVAAVRARAAELPLDVTVTAADEAARYGPAVESACYYAVSEALTNVIKHAHATAATVDIDGRAEGLRITVTDDGTGLGSDPEAASEAPGGTGLRGLRDRLEALGGRLTVASTPLGGTTVELLLPTKEIR